VKDGDSSPQFCQVRDNRIPLRVVPVVGISHRNWLTELQSELSTPFDPGCAPLVRAVLMHEPYRATLILTAHHSLADGLSLTFAIHDTLVALSGNPREPLLATPSMESMLDSADSRTIDLASKNKIYEIGSGKPSVFRRITVWCLTSVDWVWVLNWLSSFESGHSKKKQQCTALFAPPWRSRVRRAINEWKDKPVRVLSPIDIRKLLGIGERCGLFVSSGIVSFKPDEKTTFWEPDRFAKRQLAGAQTRDGVTALIHSVRQAVSRGPDVDAATQLAAHGFAREAELTNLGDLRYETNFGKFKLEALWGPAIAAGFEGGQTIGVVVNEALNLLHTTYAPVPFLLERIEHTLHAAC
jgi:hypothetical protein